MSSGPSDAPWAEYQAERRAHYAAHKQLFDYWRAQGLPGRTARAVGGASIMTPEELALFPPSALRREVGLDRAEIDVVAAVLHSQGLSSAPEPVRAVPPMPPDVLERQRIRDGWVERGLGVSVAWELARRGMATLEDLAAIPPATRLGWGGYARVSERRVRDLLAAAGLAPPRKLRKPRQNAAQRAAALLRSLGWFVEPPPDA
jgi:hypothetical protein